MTVSLEKAAEIHRQTSQVKRYSDRLVGIGPFGIGIDGVLSWVPVAGTAYSAGAGALMILQAFRAHARPYTVARMLAYIGLNTATASIWGIGSAIDFLFPGHLMAANALLKDIEKRHPELKPVKGPQAARRAGPAASAPVAPAGR